MIANLLAFVAATMLAQAQPALPPLPAVPAPSQALPPLPEVPRDAPKSAKSVQKKPAQPAKPAAAAVPKPALVEPADPAWSGWMTTARGSLGGLALPTLSTPGAAQMQVAASLDWHRGGDFLFPGSTSQRTGWALAMSYGVQSWLEAYGSLGFHATNLFGPAGRRTLGSYGDLDAGLKVVLPRRGPLSGGALIELDVPSGVGGFSLKGVGGRAALLAGMTGRLASVPWSATAIAGYRLDNSGALQSGLPTTFASYALALSRYDRVEGGVSLALPFERISPSAEVELEAPVARQNPLPQDGAGLLARLTLGAQAQVASGVTLQAGFRWSLSRDGRLSERSLPVAGLATNSPWQIFAGFGYSFEPRVPRLPKWSRDKQPVTQVVHAPAAPNKPVQAKAKLLVVATDAKAHTPVGGAWITFVDSSDPGATTGPDGRARLEHEAGAVTIAVAHEKYELWTEPLLLVAGEEKQLVISLQPNAANSVVRGRIMGEDAVPLRALITLSTASGVRALETRWYEGSFAIPMPHGRYNLTAATPGFRADPIKVDVRPGETVTADVTLRRIAGEPAARVAPNGIEMSRPVPFVPARSALFPVAFPVLGELAALLKADGRSYVVEVRVEADELPKGFDPDAQSQVLSSERARSVVQFLEDKGVPKGRLTARGAGLAKPGQPLVDVVVAAPQPRTSLPPAPGARIALGGHP